MISREERWLLHTLAQILQGAEIEENVSGESSKDWDCIVSLSEEHAVASLLYPLVEHSYGTEMFCSVISDAAVSVVQQNYRLMFLTHYVVNKLEKAGVPVVTLKGVSAAAYYPVPELRKTGDVDLFLPNAKQMLERAAAVLDAEGFCREEKQRVNHHYVWRTSEGIEIELHVMLAEPFDNRRVNRYLEKISDQVAGHICRKEIMGLCFPVLSEEYQAFQLLLHMLQHFLRSGFGVKLLCDWVVFWNRSRTEEERIGYRRLIAESGLDGFSDMITGICVEYLGLEPEKGRKIQIQEKAFCYDDFLEDILESAEFGQNDESRMVALRGGQMKDYIREFHHQTKLTYPKVSKCCFLWPVLWGIVFWRFSKNNKQIRGVSMWQILKKTRERSHKMEQLHLFRKVR